ncbi:MTH1187 family thiamine-binding protein [Paenactinomyces guangxiensis]|uniref:MTH1187 family thiamine-binding protein n=1 Tax=Paenactinomyces guangxiensis TaxID=1490290 RepID=A0A7W2A6P6_9BACL|nr:MTH1187 family thiamine-binding protein [Paenactinomyces guangxiensis]MBA4492770.1 MTH1187 family thiamine-binding protein [Paenactinomyces guangxiensis]MBH8590381.1 MTH1187 family thiamine-binding protein [Paenactinomyces guangxiensis]
MPFLEISVVPVGTNTASFSSYVTDAVNLIEQSGLNYQITPTATVIEGEIGQLMDVAKAMHENVIANGATRVITNICIDHRTDKNTDMIQQVKTAQK